MAVCAPTLRLGHTTAIRVMGLEKGHLAVSFVSLSGGNFPAVTLTSFRGSRVIG